MAPHVREYHRERVEVAIQYARDVRSGMNVEAARTKANEALYGLLEGRVGRYPR